MPAEVLRTLKFYRYTIMNSAYFTYNTTYNYELCYSNDTTDKSRQRNKDNGNDTIG